jgi:hypothetical protein
MKAFNKIVKYSDLERSKLIIHLQHLSEYKIRVFSSVCYFS